MVIITKYKIGETVYYMADNKPVDGTIKGYIISIGEVANMRNVDHYEYQEHEEPYIEYSIRNEEQMTAAIMPEWTVYLSREELLKSL